MSRFIVLCLPLLAWAQSGRGPIAMRSPGNEPWFVDIEKHESVKPEEHPRLLFRKAQVKELRRRATTPEGKAILQRLDEQLKQPYTIGHAAGYGFLFQLTGDPRYAEEAKQCFEKALAGVRDRDSRYSFRSPGGALRAGPSVGWMALGYDLAYEGWDPATRERFGRALYDYAELVDLRGGKQPIGLAELAKGTMPPGSNHFGMQVGGAALALLAIEGEPWAKPGRMGGMLIDVEASLLRNISEGFGNGGFFAEGDGTGSMSSQIVFLTALHAWRSAKGRDYILGPRPNVRMMSLKWAYQTLFINGVPRLWPIRGGYPHNVWSRKGMSGAAYFAQGVGAVKPDEALAMKWIYERFLAVRDSNEGTPWDTASDYPQYSIVAFVNWPFAKKAKRPEEVLPLVYRDEACGFYCWRSGWEGPTDTVITLLTNDTRGYMGALAEDSVAIHTEKVQRHWAKVGKGETKHWSRSPRGEISSLMMADGSIFAVDFSGASGQKVLLISNSPADGATFQLGGKTFTAFSPQAKGPLVVETEKNGVRIGKQRIRVGPNGIEFAKGR